MPTGSDGVIMAEGGPAFGFALYLADGRPHFMVRTDGEAFDLVGPDKLAVNQPVHVAGMLGADQKLRLFVDGRQVAEGEGALLTEKPANSLLTIGSGRAACGWSVQSTRSISRSVERHSAVLGDARFGRAERLGQGAIRPKTPARSPSEGASRSIPSLALWANVPPNCASSRSTRRLGDSVGVHVPGRPAQHNLRHADVGLLGLEFDILQNLVFRQRVLASLFDFSVEVFKILLQCLDVSSCPGNFLALAHGLPCRPHRRLGTGYIRRTGDLAACQCAD